MAQQQAMFFDVISSMKRATARHDDASDSDESILAATNRGNKLKRKAKYVREGRLAQADGPRVYKRNILYNGYARNVISKNAPRVDPDGDLIDEEDNSDPDLSPAEDDPYAETKLEHLLMPLTNAADLDKHPSMSVPYTSKVLDEMVQDAQDMLHREERALWRIKQLLVQFRGDDGWAPCGMFETGSDPLLLQSALQNSSAAPSLDLEEGRSAREAAVWDTTSHAQPLAGGTQPPTMASVGQPQKYDVSGNSIATDWSGPTNTMPKANLDDGSAMHVETIPQETLSSAREQNAHTENSKGDPRQQPPALDPQQTSPPNGDMIDKKSSMQNGNANTSEDVQMANIAEPGTDGGVKSHEGANGATEGTETMIEDAEVSEDEGGSQAHRMTTRARAQANPDAASQTSQQPDADSTLPIHPFFIAPLETLPFRAQGLVAPLSDDIRMVLSAYAQRQEEVVRQCKTLLAGLQKALHLKQTVWSWCRNEGHVGEMSDGEDWIDMEEWGLDEPLKKGEEVEDEEVAVGLTTKKTRNRRAAA